MVSPCEKLESQRTPDVEPGVRKWVVFVSSCDAFSDLWPSFFFCFFKYFKANDIPVFLVSNFKSYPAGQVQTIPVGVDEHWAANTAHALKKIDAEYVLYLQDDYLLNAPLDPRKIDELIDLLEKEQGHYLRLYLLENLGRETGFNGIVELSAENQWMCHLQAAIWRKETLLDFIVPGQNPWESESTVNQRAKKCGHGFFTITATSEPILQYVEGVKGGFWTPQGVACCRTMGIIPDLRKRPCPPPGNEWHRKLYRSWLKRRMILARWWEERSPSGQ